MFFFGWFPRQVTNSKSKSGSKKRKCACKSHTYRCEMIWKYVCYTHAFVNQMTRIKRQYTNLNCAHTTFHHIKSRTKHIPLDKHLASKHITKHQNTWLKQCFDLCFTLRYIAWYCMSMQYTTLGSIALCDITYWSLLIRRKEFTPDSRITNN